MMKRRLWVAALVFLLLPVLAQAGGTEPPATTWQEFWGWFDALLDAITDASEEVVASIYGGVDPNG